jgi:hypothetical protein
MGRISPYIHSKKRDLIVGFLRRERVGSRSKIAPFG